MHRSISTPTTEPGITGVVRKLLKTFEGHVFSGAAAHAVGRGTYADSRLYDRQHDGDLVLVVRANQRRSDCGDPGCETRRLTTLRHTRRAQAADAREDALTDAAMAHFQTCHDGLRTMAGQCDELLRPRRAS